MDKEQTLLQFLFLFYGHSHHQNILSTVFGALICSHLKWYNIHFLVGWGGKAFHNLAEMFLLPIFLGRLISLDVYDHMRSFQ